MNNQVRVGIAEAIGTFILIVGGPGSAILAAEYIGVLGVALAFGLALLVGVYTIGVISGCHINPAVTLGAWLAGKVETALVPFYVGGQVVGAFVGGVFLVMITSTVEGFSPDPDNFAVNGWANLSPAGFNFTAMMLMEIVLTALLVFVVLSTTHREYSTAVAGVHVGLTLALIHLISIPVDNTSVNPVRSFAVAIFAGGDALEQLWAFIVFPLVGAVLGWLAHSALQPEPRLTVGPQPG